MWNPFPSSRVLAAVVTAVFGTVILTGRPVHSNIYEPIPSPSPITVAVEDAITPGETVPVNVTLTGNSTCVTITSDPPGAVSYSGAVNASSVTVNATTDPTLAPGTAVTVYASTDGQTVVSTSAVVGASPAASTSPVVDANAD